jgi:hypothetical protein
VKRRAFVFSAAMAPWLIRRAFGDVSIVGGAVRPSTRPLLVLLIPEREDERDARGGAFGAYLNHGSDAQLAPLGNVEVACATARQLDKKPPRDSLLAFVSTDGKIAWSSAGGIPSRRWEDEDKSNDAIIDFIAQRVRAIAGPPRADLHAAAEEVRARIVKKAPAGAHWANVSACGYAHVEDLVDREADEKMSVDCGMGFSPDKSSRFLYFFSQTPARRALLERHE